MKLILTLALILLTSTSYAANLSGFFAGPQGRNFSFADFESAENPAMICERGPCKGAEQRISTSISSYVVSNDQTTMAGLPIEAPRFDYYDNKLFRVTLRFASAAGKLSENLKRIDTSLIDDYGMTFVKEERIYTFKGDGIKRYYNSSTGILATVKADQDNESGVSPLIEFYTQDSSAGSGFASLSF